MLCNIAGVAELEYAHALGACFARIVGSSPTAGTNQKTALKAVFLMHLLRNFYSNFSGAGFIFWYSYS